MKTVNEVLGKIKGEDKLDAVIPGKGAFSQQGFGDAVNALINDTTFRVKTFDKNGQPAGDLSISELIRDDIKKTLEKAKYPQKPEAAVLDTAEIVTSGITKAIPHIVMEYMKAGKKFDLPNQASTTGSIYLADLPGKTKESKVRDPKTQKDMGSVVITTQDSIQIRAKSPVPKHLKTKVRKDPSGKVVE